MTVPQIPDKLYFKIGEVAALTGVKPHVLRYWEAEFGTFRPSKSRTQQRLYQRKDIELVLRLKQLLYEQGYTIAGARKKLRASFAGDDPPSPPPPLNADREELRALRNELLRIRSLLDRPLTGSSR